ncbi:muts domain V-domain-containing protein [Geopyxis carbonaria]|nr:muts domain V-domain-containing protein [Geopyxis carbonaria]
MRALRRPPPLWRGPPTARPPLLQHRTYAKRTTKSTLHLSDLPQGALPPLMPLPPATASSAGPPKYPPVILQALTTMSALPPATALLTRVGGFYELYFAHAVEYAPLLGLKVGVRRTNAGPVPMAGFPLAKLEAHLRVLVEELNRNVAVAEEFGVPGQTAQWERRIARVVTPGTLLEESAAAGDGERFLMALEDAGAEVALAWCDLATGETWCAVRERSEVRDEVVRVGPREVVVGVHDGELAAMLDGDEQAAWVVARFAHDGAAEAGDGWRGRGITDVERRAGATLLEYVRARLPEVTLHLQPPTRRSREDTMKIDAATMRGLEITHTMRTRAHRGSLVHAVNRTVTRGGRRLLALRLSAPSTDVATIEARLDLVEVFVNDEALRGDVTAMLKRSCDSQRILQKFSLGKGDADDLIALARTIDATEELRKRLAKVKGKPKALTALVKQLKAPLELAKMVGATIDEEGLQRKQRQESDGGEGGEEAAHEALEDLMPARQKRRMVKEVDKDRGEAWVIKKEASKTLLALHGRLEKMHTERDELEAELRQQLGSDQLSLKWSPGLGHHALVKGKMKTKVLDLVPDARSVSSSKSTHSLHIPSWTYLGTTTDAVAVAIRQEEALVFNGVRAAVFDALPPLRTNAHALEALDVAVSSALLAQEQSLTRPRLTAEPKLHILHGRHPTVAPALAMQGLHFTPNTTILGPPAPAHVITGPNMAGKSTYLRQVALITLLAQTGLFVPATHATVGITDAVFSRIGAADNIHAAQSTFMCEMLETAHILRHATPHSLVVVDEVGRGTSPRDGAAMAWAVLHALVERRGVGRVLFATHFPEIERLATHGLGEKVRFWCTSLKEVEGGAWGFEHALQEGVNRQSHAMRVARMAGVPAEVVAEAERAWGEIAGDEGGKR